MQCVCVSGMPLSGEEGESSLASGLGIGGWDTYGNVRWDGWMVLDDLLAACRVKMVWGVNERRQGDRRQKGGSEFAG